VSNAFVEPPALEVVTTFAAVAYVRHAAVLVPLVDVPLPGVVGELPHVIPVAAHATTSDRVANLVPIGVIRGILHPRR